jgi:hypothetical protein
LPELVDLLTRVQRRARVDAFLRAIAIGGSAFALSFAAATAFYQASRSMALGVAVGVGIAATMVAAARQRGWTLVQAARAIEQSNGGLDNLIVTAAELEERPRPVRAEIRDEIMQQAASRAASIDLARAIPLAHPIAIAASVIIGCALLSQAGSSYFPVLANSAPATEKGSGLFFSVRITPPSYTRRRVEVFENPVQITAISGSRIQVETATGATLRDWIATESAGVELEISPDPFSRKFLAVTVLPDAAPSVRIIAPGKDSAFAEAKGRVDVSVEGVDDLGLTSLVLRFTKASGGGENVSFTDGDVPLQIDRRGDQHWNARASIDLASLGLADGDTLVYRAIARDSNPDGAPVPSEQYLIEIGKNSEIADAGFALPSEEKKYAISQQMVIYKTEQLLAATKSKNPPGNSGDDEWLNQARMIAVEQRMVRAEVVFLGGGEVEDEVEEAAKSDELTEGRLQNTGRAEMLRAINAMSRAEAQLNDGRVTEALVFEKQALASLERALDRRRYFLRTLPDRSRIDTGRRLTGDRREARSWNRQTTPAGSPASLDAQRRLMRELAATPTIDARLAARVAAIEPSSKDLQAAAVALAGASSDDSKRAAVRQAMAAITAHALASLPASTPLDLHRESLSGFLANELPSRPQR